jgi:hypothetical protein
VLRKEREVVVVVRGGVGSCAGPLYRREKAVGRPGFKHEELVWPTAMAVGKISRR